MEGETPLLRQWQLITELASRRQGMTIKELAAEHGVVERTIRRDLHTLREVGFPLVESVGDHGRKHWRLEPASFTPPLSFNWDEAVALLLARRHLEPLAGTPLWESAQKAFRKIRATLTEQVIAYLEKMSTAFHSTSVGAGDYAKKGEIIDQLMVGIEDHRISFITYQSASATEPVTYEIYPYGIVFHRHSLYLVAHSVSHNEIRHFKIDRISHVELDRLKFNAPANFDLQKHLAGSFGVFRRGNGPLQRIRIRFSSPVARYVEESHWHDSQKLERQRDGSLLFEVTLGATEEIKSWVLSFGRHAEVLEPTTLRQALAEEIQQMAQHYATTAGRKNSRARKTKR